MTDSDLQISKRVSQASRKRLMLFSQRPQSPRGVQFNAQGYVAWDEPQELRNVTHYNVYAGSDQTLYRRYPVGTKVMNDLMPDTLLVWVSSWNEEAGSESHKVAAAAAGGLTGTTGIPGTTPVAAAPAPNVTGLTVSNARTNADENSEMVRITGSFTLPAVVSDYNGARVVGQVSGDTSWTILAQLGATDTSFNGPWMPAPRTNATWTVKVQPYNADGVLNPLDGSTPTATTTITAGVAGYNLQKVIAGTYDSVDFGIDGSTGNFKVLNVNLTKAFNYTASEFQVSGGAFTVNGLSATKINAGILKVGGVSGMAGRVSVVDSDNVTQIAWIGFDGGSYRGGWFKNLYVGGSDPSTANITAVGSTVTMKGITINMGPGTTGANGQIWVYNSASIIGWIGTNGGFNGAWFSNLYIGGSGPGSAKVYIDGGGNAQFTGNITASAISGSTFTFTAGNVTTALDPGNGTGANGYFAGMYQFSTLQPQVKTLISPSSVEVYGWNSSLGTSPCAYLRVVGNAGRLDVTNQYANSAAILDGFSYTGTPTLNATLTLGTVDAQEFIKVHAQAVFDYSGAVRLLYPNYHAGAWTPGTPTGYLDANDSSGTYIGKIPLY